MPAHATRHSPKTINHLSDLRNVGPATLELFALLGIEAPEQLATQNADQLYLKLSALRGQPVDPCVNDVFSAAIHQARTGDALPWWHFTAERKRRRAQSD